MKKFLIILACMAVTHLSAQPGMLDNSFGTFGVAFPPFISSLSYGYGLAIQSDGKIVVTGHTQVGGVYKAFIVRYDTNGNPDLGFPPFITGISTGSEYGRAVAIQTDGMIVVAGQKDAGNSDILVLRLTPAGSYDTTFGAGGIVSVDLQSGSDDQSGSLVIQPDGKILVAGWSTTLTKVIAMLRLNPNGSVDTTFGNNGRVLTNLAGLSQQAHAVKLQPDGKILVAGLVSSPVTANDLVVLRYYTDGSIDSTFATNGIARPMLQNDDDAALSMALQADGKIVTAGYIYNNFTYADNLVVRFDSTGALDATFNGTGVLASNPLGNDNISYGVLVQVDGKIVTTGRAWHLATLDFTLSRFNTNGSVDASFGTNGFTYTPIAIEEDYILASAMQSDGKIVATGYYTDGGIENFIVARYLNDSSLASSVNELDERLTLYPQPASGILHLGWKPGGSDVIAEIYSVDGALLDSHELDRRGILDVQAFPTGMYFLRLIENGQSACWRKFVVQR